MTGFDTAPVVLSIKLAAVTVIILLIIGTPLAWWLAFTRNRFRVIIEAMTALPLVLPPTVLGFYLLILMGPAAVPGRWWVSVAVSTMASRPTWGRLRFTSSATRSVSPYGMIIRFVATSTSGNLCLSSM